MNFPNRVPVLANPQEGSSMLKPSRAWKARSVCVSLSMEMSRMQCYRKGEKGEKGE